ncbi:MAG: hypothetical protein K9L17_06135 [Clostridiales bacterium]|nr:hypothetical protein [Clostridiales bacterium]MCF8022250.1 hypothetical protein [Clostridiales bacterium]
MLDKIYEKYYATEASRTPTEWYNILYKKVTSAKTQDEMKQAVENELNNYVKKIWTDDGAVAALQAELQGHGFTYEAGFDDAEKERLNKVHKSLLIKTLQPVFTAIEKNLRSQVIKDKVIAKNKAEHFLKYRMNIKVSVSGGSPDDTVRAELWKDNKKIAAGEEYTIEDPYTGHYIDGFSIKVIDYIKYGMPKTIKVTLTGKNDKKITKSNKIRMYSASDVHVDNFRFKAPKLSDEDEKIETKEKEDYSSQNNNSSYHSIYLADYNSLTAEQKEILNADKKFQASIDKYTDMDYSIEEVDKIVAEAYQEYFKTIKKYIDTGKYTGDFEKDFVADKYGTWELKYDYDILEEIIEYANNQFPSN